MKDEIRTFENQKIRTAWDEKEEEWYFSVVDVIAVLTGSRDPAAYWRKLKQRLLQEGNETVTNCHRLKLPAADGKMRLTDVADLKQLFRLIQSVPSPRAEPLKRWLAEVGRERVEETIDPELTIERALETYARKGYSREWINQRLQAIQVRKELTDEWQDRGVQAGWEFAILTDEITRAWSGMTTRPHRLHRQPGGPDGERRRRHPQLPHPAHHPRRAELRQGHRPQVRPELRGDTGGAQQIKRKPCGDPQGFALFRTSQGRPLRRSGGPWRRRRRAYPRGR